MKTSQSKSFWESFTKMAF